MKKTELYAALADAFQGDNEQQEIIQLGQSIGSIPSSLYSSLANQLSEQSWSYCQSNAAVAIPGCDGKSCFKPQGNPIATIAELTAFLAHS